MHRRGDRKIPETTRELIVRLFTHGRTLQEIGDVFDVTRERIRQLLRAWNVAPDAGGSRMRSFVNRTDTRRRQLERKARKDSRTERVFDCSIEEVERIAGPDYARRPWVSMHKRIPGPGLMYMEQKRNAERRLVEWKFSLPEWWAVWEKSGKFEQRGRGRGNYVMARLGDRGPYSTENVYIAEFCENILDYYGCAEHKAEHRRRRNAVQVAA